ncbi:MAG TPA: MarR family transcriptional regulator [Stackebrandtia sp.]|uniref:MarR family winged helix-turn-helix transcriptional regulator n=1 Tax=Stackebrandtia sp. TaxID=2023065 RepID=UPI002D2851D2|nr:MarR family transcriptional regulator [Stackebrandtia sp.]HZE41268.1 MarR family transcriptional regulator [Stackebrandtia sp.]
MTPDELAAISKVPLISAFFRRAHDDMPDALREIFTTHGLGPRHGAVMSQLMARQPASVGDLAARLHVSLSAASKLVSELDRAGLATRTEDPANRRRTLVSVAPDARGVFADFIAARSASLMRAMDQLSPRDRAGFLKGLNAWAEQEEARNAADGG